MANPTPRTPTLRLVHPDHGPDAPSSREANISPGPSTPDPASSFQPRSFPGRNAQANQSRTSGVLQPKPQASHAAGKAQNLNSISDSTRAAPTPAIVESRSERAVYIANRAAASLTATDARWILATLTARSIEGGRAGIIRPEIRRRLVARAQSMGLRPFDANLVIAIMQDDARSTPAAGGASTRSQGADHAESAALPRLSPDVIDRLTLVKPAPHEAAARAILIRLSLAALAGIAGAVLLARWLVGA